MCTACIVINTSLFRVCYLWRNLNPTIMMEEVKAQVNSFMSRLIDWKGFELFVADMYRDSEDVMVSHNVTEIGKSGAKRQIDVLVLHRTRLHQYKTIIECKKWKNKVDRPVIDVLAAAIDDLSASKGVVFTTVGYEEGALQYAKNKNIDIFLIRDVKDDEWGKPGRHIWFYMQLFASACLNIQCTNLRFVSKTGRQPGPIHLHLAIGFVKDEVPKEELQLYSREEEKGPNLAKLMQGACNQVLKQLYEKFNALLQPEDGSPQIAYNTPVKIDFSTYPYRFLKVDGGYNTFDAIETTLLQTVSQSKFSWDRAESQDFVLMVENYITRQRNFVSKPANSDNVKLEEKTETPAEPDKPVLGNGQVMKILTEPYVAAVLNEGVVPFETQLITVNLTTG